MIARGVKGLLLLLSAIHPAFADSRWPLWESYAARFLSDRGRIADHDSGDRTTSEGQSYALFFSLVANDRQRFQQILTWTEQNLAKDAQLPAWLWGRAPNGDWQVLDANSASDADLWLAYTLLQAARLWDDSALRFAGLSMADRILREEVVDIPGLGPMLLPGPKGFRLDSGLYQLNPSYLPVQILLGLAKEIPKAPWGAIAARTSQVVRGSSPKGFALDWIAYDPRSGFVVGPAPTSPPLASYDAIRVYLWAGMLDPKTPYQKELLRSIPGMRQYLEEHAAPPAEVTEQGAVKDANGGPVFSAALIPYLHSLNEQSLVITQTERLKSQLDPATGLYGNPPHYYDQNLALFSTGWSEKRFSFDKHGTLSVAWSSR